MENNFGVYCIENIINGKRYIGASKNIEDRRTHHFNALIANSHYNKSLQLDFNLYGINNFIFKIIENCNNEELFEKEQYYIKEFDSFNNGYNDQKGGFRSFEDHHHTKESKEKMSFATKGENNPFFNKTHSEETKEKMRENHKNYSGENHPKYGTKLEEKSLNKMSKSNQGNAKKKENSSSQYVGVGEYGNRWRSGIMFRGKAIYLGYFDTEIDAALAYNKKAIELYGVDAKLNIIKNKGE
jgi:group I intron endonuclease